MDKKAVPFFNLTRQYAKLSKKIDRALSPVLSSCQFVLSDEVAKFEKEFSKLCKVPHAIGVGSGTDALIFALKAVGIKAGDEVIVPSFTFSASVLAIVHLGAKPIYADINLSTFTLDPQEITPLISSRTKAIMVVHLFGQAADMTSIMRIAQNHKLAVIEDCAQAHGATWNHQPVGSFGDVGCFSFYPTKNLGGYGDGGIMTLRDKKLLPSLYRFRNLGRKDFAEAHMELGWTSRLDAMQAAILRIKLGYLEQWNSRRNAIAETYIKKLQYTPLVLPCAVKKSKHVYHLFVVRAPFGRRDALVKELEKEKIGAKIYYATPSHRQPVLKGYAQQRKLHLPNTELAVKQVLALPMFPELSNREVDRVCSVINRFYHHE